MNLIIVNEEADLNTTIAGAEIITAEDYLSENSYSQNRRIKIYNLCRSYRYQSTGYYVSLLASARKHQVFPDTLTLQDTHASSIIKLRTDDFEELLQEILSTDTRSEVSFYIFFGKAEKKEYEILAARIYHEFTAPIICVTCIKHKNKWHFHQVNIIPISDLEEKEKEKVTENAKDFFSRRRKLAAAGKEFNLGILVNSDEDEPPSNTLAIENFISSARDQGIHAVTIGREDYSHLNDYDGLFIRETTSVNHYTYRFARRAEVEGLVAIDDPMSIVKCCNKVYLAEILLKNKIATPFTSIIHKSNAKEILKKFQYPFILKLPDSAFSAGVKKVSDAKQLKDTLEIMFDNSELLIVQEFFPTDYDWRIGIIDKQPLFACKYFMANGHWQIIDNDKSGNEKYGNFDIVKTKDVPDHVMKTAIRASNLIGDGLYGVDIKQVGGKSYVIEVNDNPNIDAGVEDSELGEELYERIMKVFLKRMNQLKSIRR